MTVAHHAPALRAPSLAAAVGALRALPMLEAAGPVRHVRFVDRFTHCPIVGLCASCKEHHAHS